MKAQQLKACKGSKGELYVRVPPKVYSELPRFMFIDIEITNVRERQKRE